MGFAVIVGSQTFNTPGTYPVPKGFRAVAAVATNGNPGNPGNPSCPLGIPGSAGNAGGTSKFKCAGTTTYQRSASTLQPRAGIAVVAGVQGTGGAGGNNIIFCNCNGSPTSVGFPGNPGSSGNPGSVVVTVS